MSSASWIKRWIDWLRRRGNQKDLLRWVLFIFDGSHGSKPSFLTGLEPCRASARIASKIDPPNLTGTREAEEKSHLKQFAEEPKLEIRAGRWGPYIAYDGKNYKIPKKDADRAAELTLEECLKLVEAEQKKTAKPRRGRKA